MTELDGRQVVRVMQQHEHLLPYRPTQDVLDAYRAIQEAQMEREQRFLDWIHEDEPESILDYALRYIPSWVGVVLCVALGFVAGAWWAW